MPTSVVQTVSQTAVPYKRITKLSPLLINQIAAGEVVTRPASVVKELVENAIDAGATQISIHIEQGGLGLIQISDNGRGIHPDDMILAVTRHATSKLADVSELTGINSLGFRGEALASIAAVAHLTLTSSHDGAGIGRQLVLSGNDASQATITPVVKSQGTTVSVRDLYFNIPARRSNLKSIATEFAHIEQVVQRIGISFAHIQLELYHQNKLRLRLSGDDNQPNLPRLEQALGQPLHASAQPFFLSLQALQMAGGSQKPASISGWVFLPLTLNQTLPKLIYINQRLVTDLAISQTLAKAARQADIEGMGYALFFDLPQTWLNVNIHPTKQQVKIQPLTNMLALLNQAWLQLLKTQTTPQTTVPETNGQPLSSKQRSTPPTPWRKDYPSNQAHGTKPSLATGGSYPSYRQWQAIGEANQRIAEQVGYNGLAAENSATSGNPLPSRQVQEAHHGYQVMPGDTASGALPIVLGYHYTDGQQLALVSWQQQVYLIDNAMLAKLSQPAAAIEALLTSAKAQCHLTDLAEWLLRHA